MDRGTATIQANYDFLLDVLDPDDGLTAHLISKFIFQLESFDYIQNGGANRTRKARCERFLSLLMSTGEPGYTAFLPALDSVGYEHVAARLRETYETARATPSISEDADDTSHFDGDENQPRNGIQVDTTGVGSVVISGEAHIHHHNKIKNITHTHTINEQQQRKRAHVEREFQCERDVFHETPRHRDARQMLRENKILILTGPCGSGKSSTAKALLREYKQEGYTPVILHAREDWRESHDHKAEQAILIEDIFGSSAFDRSLYDSWSNAYRDMLNLVHGQDSVLIITVRTDVWEEAKKIPNHDLDDIAVLDMAGGTPLTDEDKVQMALKHVQVRGGQLEEGEREEIARADCTSDFPLLCRKFADKRNIAIFNAGIEAESTDATSPNVPGEEGVLQENVQPATCPPVTDKRLKQKIDQSKWYVEHQQEVFVETSAFRRAKEKLTKFNQLILTGPKGSGKSMLAKALIRQFGEEGFTTHVIQQWQEWQDIITNESEKQAILIEDIFGNTNFDDRKFEDWSNTFTRMFDLVLRHNCALLITLPCHILEAAKKMQNVNFDTIQCLNVAEETPLTKEEKKAMLLKRAEVEGIQLQEAQVQDILDTDCGAVFPGCLERYVKAGEERDVSVFQTNTNLSLVRTEYATADIATDGADLVDGALVPSGASAMVAAPAAASGRIASNISGGTVNMNNIFNIQTVQNFHPPK